MAETPHIFPRQQTDFLRAMKDGRYCAPTRARTMPASVSLVSKMPPVYEQALRGTCVANAVTALLEYYEDCRTRLSVQYLFEATKEIERAALERNLAHLRTGEALDPAFEGVFHAKLLQLRMLADANGGFRSPALRPYLDRFDEGVRTRFAAAEGSLLRSCFRALEFRGTCRYALWPYAGVSAAPLFGGHDAAAFPPGSNEDARKHRVLAGLYLFRAPNNVDEIRGVLAGANDRRPMPVCVTVDFFAGCDNETFVLPETVETENGLASSNAWKGVHGMALVGYVDNASYPGGGYFIVRNSLGEGWGNHGHGKLPYAYVECFAQEAGTILQDLVDYTGDGYGGLRTGKIAVDARPVRRGGRLRWLAANLLIGAALVCVTVAVGVFFDDPLRLRRPSDPSDVSKWKEYSYVMTFVCGSKDEAIALKKGLTEANAPFAVERLPGGGWRFPIYRIRMLAPEGAPDARRVVADWLSSGWTGGGTVDWHDGWRICCEQENSENVDMDCQDESRNPPDSVSIRLPESLRPSKGANACEK